MRLMERTGTERSRVVRRLLWVLLAVFAVLLVGGVAAATRIGAIRAAVADTKDEAAAALDALRSGDFDAALERLDRARTELDGVSTELSHPALLVARFTPVVGHELRATQDLIETSRSAVNIVQALATDIAPRLREGGSLVPAPGVFDLEQLDAIHARLRDAEPELTEIASRAQRQLEAFRFGATRSRGERLVEDLVRIASSVRDGVTLTEILPGLLGRDGPRTYLVLLQNLAEARGTGGLIGGFAVLRARDGVLAITDIGSNEELRPQPGTEPVPMPEWFAERYDRYQARVDWRNANMEPHLPVTAQLLVKMFERDKGIRPDVVVMMDPYTLEELVNVVGEVTTEGLTFKPNETAGAIMIDSYDTFVFGPSGGNVIRKDAMVALTELLLPRVLDPDNAMRVGTAFAAAASDEHLALWSSREIEEAGLARLGLDGSFRGAQDKNWIGVSFNNGAGNKMDAYLTQAIDVVARQDGSATVLDVEVRFSMGRVNLKALSFYVTGPVPRTVGLSAGQERLLVSILLPPGTQIDATSAADGGGDGSPSDPVQSSIDGIDVIDGQLNLFPGKVASLSFQARIQNPLDEFIVFTQGGARPVKVNVHQD